MYPQKKMHAGAYQIETFRSDYEYDFFTARSLALLNSYSLSQCLHLNLGANVATASRSFVFLPLLSAYSAMFSKKNILAASLMLFLDDVLDEDELFLIFSETNRKNP